ncbi:MAG: hypothetical protein LCH30_08400 [Proteobacteria bacterium]|nr:hypothetical protein [Pseudomonadota bacterium]
MTNNIAENLLENAYEFSKRASKDLENKDYKFSLIHFCSSIEQILKARLIIEHWMLVIDKNDIDSAKITEFQQGINKTIPILSVLKRSENLFDNVNKAYVSCIEDLFKERNKIMHFYSSKISNKDEQLEIVRLIFRSWYLTHNIIETSKTFEPFKSKFNLINTEMMKFKEYLGVIFMEKKPQLDALEKAGNDRTSCEECGYSAFFGDSTDDLIKEGKCMVCAHDEIYIKIECQSCKRVNCLFYSHDLMDLKCSNDDCGLTITCNHNAILNELEGVSDDPKHGCDYPSCSECETQYCVGMFKNVWLCSNCLCVHDVVSQCEFCGEYVTRYKEDSYLSGCGFCEGRLGYEGLNS